MYVPKKAGHPGTQYVAHSALQHDVLACMQLDVTPPNALQRQPCSKNPFCTVTQHSCLCHKAHNRPAPQAVATRVLRACKMLDMWPSRFLLLANRPSALSASCTTAAGWYSRHLLAAPWRTCTLCCQSHLHTVLSVLNTMLPSVASPQPAPGIMCECICGLPQSSDLAWSPASSCSPCGRRLACRHAGLAVRPPTLGAA